MVRTFFRLSLVACSGAALSLASGDALGQVFDGSSASGVAEMLPAGTPIGPAPMVTQPMFGGLVPEIASPLDDLSANCDAPAITESSGTWIRRGLWYADLDAVIMTRTWDGYGIPIAFQKADSPEQFGTTTLRFQQSLQERTLGETSPGSEGMPRLSLGRFLFRDGSNRDHNAEFVAWGGGEWNEGGTVEAVSVTGLTITTANVNGSGIAIPLSVPAGLQSPTSMTGFGQHRSFNGAQSMDYNYAARFNSFEWNYSVTDRMRRDRMEMQPNGEWLRRASPGWTQEYVAGLRYFDQSDNVDWTATNIAAQVSTGGGTSVPLADIEPAVAGQLPDGTMRTTASNNIFGPQLGYGITYESDRWNISVSTKQGFMVNDARGTRTLNVTGATAATDPSFSSDVHDNTLSYMATFNVLTRYHLRPNLSLRLGWELLYVTSTATAPSLL
ncbi:MAG: BBP7 family outer membrane beta-barrel protein, partial [Lacipirellulaceae bacterium]